VSHRLVILTEIIAPYRIPVFNALAQQEGIDLHVIFLAENDPTLRKWRTYKDEIHFSFQVLQSWRRRVGTYSALLNWGVSSALRRASPDAILCGGYNYIASWKCLWWARRNHVPFFLWVESTPADLRRNNPLVESLKTNFLRRSHAFVVPGKSSFAYLRGYGAREEMIYTAPNAVDIEFFRQGAQKARDNATDLLRVLHLPARYFLFVGRLVSEKGVFDLLRAYGALAAELRREIGLVFAGEGSARPELERRAAAIGPGTVHFAGFVQREQLPTYYGLADVLVFPTRSDPWGLVVNEAMACGLPVIASSVAGCSADLVEDDWNGRVVRAGDISQFAHSMNELTCDAALRSLMGRRGRERILRYSPEACAAGIAGAVLSSEVPREY
jgi:glycosyltransferase involved in cell wall biosynthesis